MRKRRWTTRPVGAALVLLLLLAGCAETPGEWDRGGLLDGVTDHTDRVTSLWVGAWIAALLVGALVWGLILWATIRFRRRPGETGLPRQVRYNLPIEALYTLAPVIVVLVFFYFTARDEAEILEVDGDAAVKIDAIGKRWGWDFNYKDAEEQPIAWVTGTPADPPVLYLPVGEKVEFELYSRDVMHSFWVPAFLFKLDMIPGRTNTFELVPQQEGSFIGRCAELCGVDHPRMLFEVQVVSREEYDAVLEQLVLAGQEGELDPNLGPDRRVERPEGDDFNQGGMD